VGYVACLDASVLVPLASADPLLRLARAEIYRPIWSAEILDEVRRTLVREQLVPSPERADKRIRAMTTAFEDASVSAPATIAVIPATVQPDDRHVVATAVVGGASVIVTNNVPDFAAADLDRDLGILVQTADEFLSDQWLIDRRRASQAIRDLLAALRNPPRSIDEHIAALEAVGLPMFAARIDSDRDLIGHE
jgi:predicted nucleic acid-binding protein